ncbi:uncharacterized protein LOC115758266 [Drosophila novamexicana]|uniref:uncharacterized protein LOC115758266 n=1 Tax=Drosophila novamexicana TaxID=47314 RepID=UPI0011E5EFE3|nr:uncharacterized protein LOC115758266 [Drosophila novamexicana]
MNNLRSLTKLPQAKSCAKLAQPILWYSSDYPERIKLSGELLKEKLRQMRLETKLRTPCYLRLRRSEYKCLAYQEIEPDPCHPEPCAVPMDVKGYKPTDKLKLNYQRTWCEFKPVPRRKRNVRKIYPALERRNPKAFRGKLCTACEPEDCELPKSPRAPPPRLFPVKTLPWPCCKFRSVTCRSSKPDGKCYPGRLPSCCVKRQTPYLSFSECKKFELAPPVTACECDQKPSVCDMWHFYRTKR